MSYERPNYTQIPNSLLDDHLPLMKEAELKVTLAIARKTFGWHKTEDQLSLSQLMRLTGLSRHSVIDGINDGIKRGTIHREQSGQTFRYSVIVQNSDQSKFCTTDSAKSAPELVQNLDTQKKDKESTKESPASQADASLRSGQRGGASPRKRTQPDPKVKEILDAYVEVRGKNGINYGKESAWAKKIVNEDGTPEEVKGCYLWLKADAFWQDKPLSLSKIFETLPEYKAMLERTGNHRQPVQENNSNSKLDFIWE